MSAYIPSLDHIFDSIVLSTLLFPPLPFPDPISHDVTNVANQTQAMANRTGLIGPRLLSARPVPINSRSIPASASVPPILPPPIPAKRSIPVPVQPQQPSLGSTRPAVESSPNFFDTRRGEVLFVHQEL